MVRRGEKSHLYSPKNRLKTVKNLKQSILKKADTSHTYN